MRETALELRYNIAALAIAICSDKYMLPEGAFSALDKRGYQTNDDDIEDMLVMRCKGMTYREIGEVYGWGADTTYSRMKRYRDKKEKDLSDGNLKRSSY